MKKILTICLAFLLFACSSTYQIDMTSKDSMNSSIEQIEKSLPVKKREAFKEALSVIVIAAAFGLIDEGKSVTDEELRNKLKPLLDKKNADEVIETSYDIARQLDEQLKK